jgi:endonuclease/exonuclease/phosphatase family metal-dependent hydrolase
MDMVKTLALCLLAGCGIDMTADKPWVPIDQIAPPLTPELAAVPSALTTTDHVRIVTYNVAEQIFADPVAIGDVLANDPQLSQASIVFLQEEMALAGQTESQARRLAERLGLGYVYAPARDVAGTSDGLAIASAFPLENIEVMELPFAPSRLRIALAADVVIGDRRIRIIDQHLETFLDAQQRVRQLHPSVIDAPPAAIVAGDFNTACAEWIATHTPILGGSSATDQAPVIDSYMAALGFAAPTADFGVTEEKYGLACRLDSIYTRGVTTGAGGVERIGPSDHWPMWLDISL